MTTTVDAVIVGGGVMGCSILYGLAVRGMARTMLLERDVLGSGSTGRSQGILRMHYSNEVTSRMAWESLQVFKDFDQAVGGASGYVRAGYVLIAEEAERHALEENVAMQKRLGISTGLVSPQDMKEIAPAISISDDEACAYEPESGYADPYSVTQGYARRARALGAVIRMNATVTGVEVRGGRVKAVTTTEGTLSTPVVVVAAGPWSRPFLRDLGVEVPLRTVRHQVVTFRRPKDQVPRHPVVGDIPNSLSACPEAGGLTLVGVGEDELASPEGYDHGVDMSVVEEVSAKLAARMPGMAQAFFRGGWSGLFTTTPDWHPILDRVEGLEGLYCAVGFSGHGFKLAPMVGAVMAEMVTQGRAASLDVSMLGLDRFRANRLLGSRYGMSVLA